MATASSSRRRLGCPSRFNQNVSSLEGLYSTCSCKFDHSAAILCSGSQQLVTYGHPNDVWSFSILSDEWRWTNTASRSAYRHKCRT